MKKLLLLLMLVFSVTQLWSQEMVSSKIKNNAREYKTNHIPLLGDSAPAFSAESTNGIIHFPSDFGHSWKILFSHPADYTPVCTTEVMELAYLQDEFNKMGVRIAVVSADAVRTHLLWKKDMESIASQNRKQISIDFPIVGDENLFISKKYGMIHPATSTTKAVRGVFIIDPDNKIAAILFYPMNVGRSTDEIIRMVTALQTTTGNKVCTPVNWKAGNDLLVPYNPTPTKDLGKTDLQPEGYYNLAWFLWYKKSN